MNRVSGVATEYSRTTADRLAELGDADWQYELDGGELIVMAPAGELHGRIEGDLFGMLYAAVKGKKLGRLYPSDTGFVLQQDPDIVRSPDVSFIRRDRLPPRTVTSEGYILGAPDLAIEIQSPSQSPADLDKKVRQYLKAGARTVWVIRPGRGVAEIHEAGEKARRIGIDGALESSVLPGVSIPLRDLLAG